MVEKLEFVPCAENEEHLARHTDTTSKVAGSKVLASVSKNDISKISKMFDNAYETLINQHGNPGRQVFGLTVDKAVGTDAVVPLETLNSSKVFELTREPGTRGEAKIKVALVSKEDMPKTNVVHAVYGPYGPTGKGGNYTLIFGDPGEPFPRELPEDAPAAHKELNNRAKQYWDNHVFLITPEECQYAIDRMKENNLPVHLLEARLKLFNHKPTSPIVQPHHSKVDANAKNLGNIALNLQDRSYSRQ